ncbi:vegetative cell wall protein gp1-like [Lycium barbarum]|uniref:vegetative cell wall protein gp1-like n=1 Tax=Lycium barbarum TaxID=112863 RepID=UPI00293F5D1A|nr:vegetative cell wall protein gp1-like [Lycium barbarum]
MLRVSLNWPKYYSLMRRIIIPIANTKSSTLLLQITSNSSLRLIRKMNQEVPQMPGQHENLPSDFPTTTTPPIISTPTDAPPAVEDSPFVPDFDAIPPIRSGENPPTPSPSPTAPRTDTPEFSDPPNTLPPGPDAPRPPTSPPSGQPEESPPRTPDGLPPNKQPPDPAEQIRTSNVKSE